MTNVNDPGKRIPRLGENEIIDVNNSITDTQCFILESINQYQPKLCSHIYDRLFNDDFLLIENYNVHSKNDYSKYFEENVKLLKIQKVIEILSTSESYDRLVKKFVKNGDLNEYYENDTIDFVEPSRIASLGCKHDTIDFVEPSRIASDNYNILKHKNLNNIVSITNEKFINLLLESYHSDNNIVEQCLLDITREDIIINNVLVNTIDQLFLILSRYNKEVNVCSNRHNISLMLLCILIICQSSFYVSFVHIHNKIKQIKHNYPDDDTIKNLELIDGKERKKIIFNISCNTLRCELIGTYRIIDIESTETKYNILARLLYDYYNDTALIVNETE